MSVELMMEQKDGKVYVGNSLGRSVRGCDRCYGPCGRTWNRA